jgi:aminoglycoside 2''-phosphotransferase
MTIEPPSRQGRQGRQELWTASASGRKRTLMGSSDPYLRRICTVYPDLAIDRLRRDDSGQYNVILIADEAIVFRFPRFAKGVARLRAETELLTAIRPYISLPIPEPRYASFDPSEPGQTFAGYPLLPGEPLWHERVTAIGDQTARSRLAAQLASFLRELHSIPVGELPIAPPPAWDFATTDWRAGCRHLYGRIEALVLPRLDAPIRDRLSAHFAAFLDDDSNFAFPPTLIHGDFGTSNILFSPARVDITAILDFGAAGLGDPACDLAAFMTYGEEFAESGFAAYPELATLLPRARFYRSTFAIQEALYGVEHGDESAIARGVVPYLT